MAEQDRTFYIAGGDDLAKARAFIDERSAVFQEMNAVAQKFGGSAVHNGRCILGIALDEQPAGWTKKGSVDGKPYYMPKRTSKALKVAYKEIMAPVAQGASGFHGLFCKDGGQVRESGGFGFKILYMVWEFVGDTLLLSVPVGSDFTPDGSTPLKMSEYWALKERARSEKEPV